MFEIFSRVFTASALLGALTWIIIDPGVLLRCTAEAPDA